MVTRFPPQLQEDIQALMATGEYDDATDILVQGVRLLARRREQTQRLRELLQIGLDQGDRGKVVEFTPEEMRQIREDAKRLAASGEPLDPDVCG